MGLEAFPAHGGSSESTVSCGLVSRGRRRPSPHFLNPLLPTCRLLRQILYVFRCQFLSIREPFYQHCLSGVRERTALKRALILSRVFLNSRHNICNPMKSPGGTGQTRDEPSPPCPVELQVFSTAANSGLSLGDLWPDSALP